MAKSSSNTGNGSTVPGECPETQKIFDDFLKDCSEAQYPVAVSNYDVATTNFNAAFNTVCDDRKSLGKAEETRAFYNSIYYHVAIVLNKDVTEIQKQVDANAKSAEELQKGFSAAVTKLKDACARLQNVDKLANDFSTACSQSCNAKTKELIDNELKKKGWQDADGNSLTLEKTAVLIQQKTLDAENAADQATETATKVAGILSFIHVKSIKGYTDKLTAQTDTFKKDAESNGKAADDKIKAAQKNLGDDLLKLSETDMNWHVADAQQLGIAAVVSYLTSGANPQPPGNLTLSDLANAVKKLIVNDYVKPTDV